MLKKLFANLTSRRMLVIFKNVVELHDYSFKRLKVRKWITL